MRNNVNITMRDAFLESLLSLMKVNDKIFFVTADFGAPLLDILRRDYSNRFLNVGIAEQNLINVSTGLALEGFQVFAYAIAPFITMRCYEQIRINLSMLSHMRNLSVTLIGVGAGCSYSMSGPTHQCLEDISIMRTLPLVECISVSDSRMASALPYYIVNKENGIQYLRFDAKLLPIIYYDEIKLELNQGFSELNTGRKVLVIATGVMTHKAIEIQKQYPDIGLIDFFNLTQYDKSKMYKIISTYDLIITLQEAFVGCGGLDALVDHFILEHNIRVRVRHFGFDKRYNFILADRRGIHKIYNCDNERIMEVIAGNIGV